MTDQKCSLLRYFDFVNFKPGTHWNHEVISMLLSGKAENVPIFKIGGMLEVLTADELEKMPSPRVLNCHFPLSMLPRQIKGNIVLYQMYFGKYLLITIAVIDKIISCTRS